MAAEAIGWAAAFILGAWGAARSWRMQADRERCATALRALEARVAEMELRVSDIAAARLASGEDPHDVGDLALQVWHLRASIRAALDHHGE